MTERKIELINDFYVRASEKEVKTAADIADVLKEFNSEGRKEIAKYVEEFCKSKNINLQDPAIADIIGLSDNSKWQKKQETLKSIHMDFGKFIDSSQPTDNPDTLAKMLTSLNLALSELDVFEDKSRVLTFADYEEDIKNYDPSKEFCIDLFDGLAFPNGTLSYVGARTARGKTTTLVNIAREALALENTRKVIFISLEMSFRQILTKIIASQAYVAAKGDLHYPTSEIYNILKDKNNVYENAKDYNKFKETIVDAASKIKKSMQEEQLIFIDGRGCSERKLINFITAYSQDKQGAVVLVDYVQRISAKQEKGSDSFRKLQIISGDLMNVAAKTNAVIIAAAQFNRMSQTDKDGNDTFSDASFRESGDIEQDSHNAIGIGWKKNKQERFYEILKTREDAKQGKKANISFVGQYSYMKRGKEIIDKNTNGSSQSNAYGSNPRVLTMEDH
jgi:hypothetical protein